MNARAGDQRTAAGRASRAPGDEAKIASMRFTLRQLEYFVAACDAGSVTEAAANIPVSQSSVSAAISQLERALGLQLLIRHHAQGVSPTPAGRRFLAAARAVLRDADQLGRFAAELTEGLSGTLEFGCLLTLAPMIAPRLCHDFVVQHPDVTIETFELAQQELLADLRSGRLSLALTYDLGLAEDIGFEPLVELPPHVMVAADHPLAGRESVALADLVDEPFVLLDLPQSRDYFHALFGAAGLAARVAHRSAHPEVVRTLVANGYGFSIVNARPYIEVALDGRPLRTMRIEGGARPMKLGVAHLLSVRPTRVAEAFHDHCRTQITDTSIPGIRV